MMKLKRTLYIFLIFLISISITHALTIETKKGDVIKGDFGMEKLKVQLQLGGVVEIPLSELIEISENMDTFKLRDGIVLRGKIADEKLNIKTRFGEVAVPLSEIKNINIGVIKEVPEVPSKITPEKKVTPEGDWRVDLKREVVVDNRFKITLQYVEKKGDTLVVGIGHRNISKEIQHLGLGHDYKDTIVLLDDDGGTEFKLIGVEGITTKRRLEIPQGAMRLVTFTFPFPQGVKKARFVSKRLSIPFSIPPEKGKGEK